MSAERSADLEAEVEQLRAALEGAISVAQWMSGSESFSPGGEAHDGWLRQREVLFAAMKVLEAVRSGKRQCPLCKRWVYPLVPHYCVAVRG